jgi:hypothetical protein
MAEFTLLKLQLDDASFTSNAPFSGTESSESDAVPGSETGGEPDPEGKGSSGDGRLLPLLVGLAFLLVVAVAVRKLRGRSGEE